MTYKPLEGQPEVHPDYRDQYNPTEPEYTPGAALAASARVKNTIAAGLATSTPDNQKRIDAAKAAEWRYSDQYEQLAFLRAHDPAGYAKMPPNLRTALGFYLDGKAAAEAAGLNVGGA